jgi:hypothetical protein
MNILIKASGDITDGQQFFDFVSEKAQNNYVVLICGGGTKINEALKKAGYMIGFDSIGRRVMKTAEEQTIMRDVLVTERERLQKKFEPFNDLDYEGKTETTGVLVVAPFLYAGMVLCPINGDDLVKAFELGFDKIYVFTKRDRIEKKKDIFKEFPKVEIIGI